MSVVLLSEAKAHLNITVITHDTELQTVLEAAEAILTQHVGPLAPVATTSRVSGGRVVIVLPVAPVISLTSITPVGGTALTVTDYQLDASAGLVSLVSGGIVGYGVYDVVYQAGRTALPADLALAVKELVRHLWESQRGAARSAISPMGDAPNVGGPGYLLPYRVQELIAPHMLHAVA